jgi:hypothetical protein
MSSSSSPLCGFSFARPTQAQGTRRDEDIREGRGHEETKGRSWIGRSLVWQQEQCGTRMSELSDAVLVLTAGWARVQGILKANGGPLSFVAAGAAGASSTSLLYPLEVVRSRMTVNAARYPDPLTALRQIAKQEGTSALYRGLPASVASIIPEAAITYGTYTSLSPILWVDV